MSSSGKTNSLFQSTSMPRARRVNEIEQSRLQWRLAALEREYSRAIRLNNQDIHIIGSTLDFIESCTGNSREGRRTQPTKRARRKVGKFRKQSARVVAITSAEPTRPPEKQSESDSGDDSDSDTTSTCPTVATRDSLIDYDKNGEPNESLLRVTITRRPGTANSQQMDRSRNASRPQTAGVLDKPDEQFHAQPTTSIRAASAHVFGRTQPSVVTSSTAKKLHVSQNKRKEMMDTLMVMNEKRDELIKSRLVKFLAETKASRSSII